VVLCLCLLALAGFCIGSSCFVKINSAFQCYPTHVIGFTILPRLWRRRLFHPLCARVRGHELVIRRDLLPDEPDHPRADQRYYKLQPWQARRAAAPHPQSRLRPITFVLTNGKRLTEAWEINDHFLGPREHDLLWRALKEARLQAERHYIIHEENAVYRVDFAVICREGTSGVICGEPPRTARPHLLYFTPAQIDAAPRKCVEAIRAAASNLGGPAET